MPISSCQQLMQSNTSETGQTEWDNCGEADLEATSKETTGKTWSRRSGIPSRHLPSSPSFSIVLQCATSCYTKINNLQRKFLLSDSSFHSAQTQTGFIQLWWWIFPRRRVSKYGAWLILQHIFLFGINFLTFTDIHNQSHTFLNNKGVGYMEAFCGIQVQIWV